MFPGHRPPPAFDLAAGVLWLAVAATPVLAVARGALPVTLWYALGFVALFAVPALYVWRHLTPDAALRRTAVVLQIPAVLLSFAVFGDGLQPVLLVLVAAQAAVIFTPRTAWLLMGLANLTLLALMLAQHAWSAAFVGALSYIAFQMFAAFATRILAAAEVARDQARRINAELLATRALLGEGARAEERLHLSRELHDLAGHKLTALKLQLAQCRGAAEHEEAALAASRQLADELLTDVRGVVGSLRAHDGVDLHRALHALAEAIPGACIALALDEAARPADLARAQALLRAAQEGVTNALRHAQAQHIRIVLERLPSTLQLRVEDDGAGPGDAPQGNGLTGLRERMAAVGGALQFAAGARRGSVLTATVPT